MQVFSEFFEAGIQQTSGIPLNNGQVGRGVFISSVSVTHSCSGSESDDHGSGCLSASGEIASSMSMLMAALPNKASVPRRGEPIDSMPGESIIPVLLAELSTDCVSGMTVTG